MASPRIIKTHLPVGPVCQTWRGERAVGFSLTNRKFIPRLEVS
jgi:hypothetical protein